MSLQRVCPQCHCTFDTAVRFVNKADRAGAKLYCGRVCAIDAKRLKHPLTPEQRKAAITHEFVLGTLAYDETTGVFVWRVRLGGRGLSGRVAGWISGGYRLITLAGATYKAHRLAWFYVNGSWPSKHIDHINGNPTDNRIKNLRQCTDAENAQNVALRKNNTSGFAGVSWDRRKKKWHASIKAYGKRNSLGYYQTKEAASSAYLNGKAELHKFQPTPRVVSL